jgi:Mitochondrial carrier protein
MSSVTPSSATASAKPAENAHSLVGSGSGAIEAVRAFLCGLLFGVTAPIVGQPIDLVKTRMQVGGRFAKTSALETFKLTVKQEGFLALYKGILPPLFGSTIFRSVQFTAYGFAFGASKDSSFMTQEVPGLAGMQLRVITSGLFSSTVRSMIETVSSGGQFLVCL